MDATQSLNGKAPATVITVEKPDKAQYNGHLTVKPVALMDHLIRLFTQEGQTVLDPYLGSGTTAVAALNAGRQCIGIEINAEYVAIAQQRIKDEHEQWT